MDLKDITLTEEDFKLLDKALEFFPEKATINNLMEAMVVAFMSKNPEEAKRRLDDKRKKNLSNPEEDMLREDIRILQGKLLLLKRYLMQQGAMKEAEDILKK